MSPNHPSRHFEPIVFVELTPTLSNRSAYRGIPEHPAAAGLPPEVVRHAWNDARSLASLTPLPDLFLPVLFEEKLVAAARWHRRQRELLDRTSISFAA